MKSFLKAKKVKTVFDLKKCLSDQEWETLQSCFGLNWELTASSVLECLSYEHLNKMNKMSYTQKMLFLFQKHFEKKKEDGTLKKCVQWLEV